MPDSAFPYGIVFKGNGAIDVFPAAQIFFSYKDGGEVSFFLLIDSGAYMTALPKSDAEPLGVIVEKGKLTLVGGISGASVRGWRHDISVRFGGSLIKLPIVFIDDDNAPRVLGRAGVFDKFTIVFEESRKRTGFLGENSKVADSIKNILDKVSKEQ